MEHDKTPAEASLWQRLQSNLRRLKLSISSRLQKDGESSQLLRRLSVYTAGFQVYSTLTGILALGTVGNWIATHWHGITRAFWDLLLVKILALDWRLSVLEKDALTAVVFFLPMGVLSFVYVAKEADSGWMDPFSRKSPPARKVFVRIVAMLCGCALVYILSHQTLGAIRDFWWPMPIPLWLANFTIMVFVPLLIVIASCRGIFGRIHRRWAEKTHAFFHGAFRFMWATGNWIAVGALLYSVWRSANIIGFVSAFCALAILYFVLWTGIRFPERLIHVAAVVLALLAIGGISELVSNFIKMLERTS